MPNRFKALLSLISAILSGVLLALCFEPWNFSWLVWVWQWPLLFALWYLPNRDPRESTVRSLANRGWWLGYLCGFVFFVISCHWFYHTGKVSAYGSSSLVIALAGLGTLIGVAVYLGIYVGLFGIFANTIGRFDWPLNQTRESECSKSFGVSLFAPSVLALKVAFLNGACWVGLEWLRSVAFSGFSWNSLGVALLETLSILQFADTIGQIGYGFVIMFCGVIGLTTMIRFYSEIRNHKIRPHLDFAVAIALVIFLFLYGVSTQSNSTDSVDLEIRINQLNIPIVERYYGDEQVHAKHMNDYSEFTRVFIDNQTPDVVMWPETALPAFLSYKPTINYFNNNILKGEDFYLIAGILDYDVNNNMHNALTIMKGHTDTRQVHNKIHLVPFGEYVPWRNTISFMDKWFGGVIDKDFSAGNSYQPLTIEKEQQSIGVIPLICFEDTVARHARQFVREGPQFIANVTNDGWFYDSSQPAQHFAASRFRCIELRRPMVRCANSGVSGFINEFGDIFDPNSVTREKLDRRIVQHFETGSTFIQGSYIDTLKVSLNPPTTFFAKRGDLFSIVLGSFAFLAFIFWLVRRLFA